MSDLQGKLNSIQDRVDEVYDTVHRIDKEVALNRSAFDDHMAQDKLIYEEFKRMNDLLQQNTESLREHMRRTDMLEDIVQKMDARFTPIELEHVERQFVQKYKEERKKKIKDIMVFWTKIAGGLSAAIAIYMTFRSMTGH
jgi:hypothetical protein